MPTKMLNYTTEVPVKRTVTECHDMLVEFGATAVTTLTENKAPVALQFQLDTPWGPRLYRMPVNVAGVRKRLLEIDKADDWPDWVKKNPKWRAKIMAPAHAADMAWRTIRDWLESQLAIIDSGTLTAPQVMLSYMMTSPEITVYDQWQESERAALEAGNGQGR